MQIRKRKIVKFGSSYAMLIPMAYVKDGNLLTDKEYDIHIELSAVEDKNGRRWFVSRQSEVMSPFLNVFGVVPVSPQVPRLK